MDQAMLDGFCERLFGEIVGSMSVLNLYLGHRLGLFRALQDDGPATPAELAARTGCVDRYVREWLECLYVSDYLEHDVATGRFRLPEEHAVALLNRDSPSYAAAFLCFIPSFARVIEPLMEAFRTGGGVPASFITGHAMAVDGGYLA